MTAVLPIVPSENWDDDFEFHPENHDNNPHARLSTASSQPTEDWDNEDTRPDNLSNWAEPGPSTPSRRQQPTTENWDDDFEDKTDSPVQSNSTRKRVAKQRSASGARLENWDDEFDLSPVSTPAKHHPLMKQDAYDDDDDDDLDFNGPDKDEDHTVTARSRRAALSRLSTNTNPIPSPPPPVPPIPLSLLNTDIHSEQPFPRSPTASVFSVPTSGRDSVAHSSFYHNNSTTHLHPTISRSSMPGFANLPPSPPIHKERERRRLRKKSRPSEPVFEMRVRDQYSSRESLGLPEEDEQMMSATPPPTSPELVATPHSNRNSTSFSTGPPPATPNKTPLLSRIGSVKKWNTRKKRTSSTPAEVLLQQTDNEQASKYSGLSPPISSPSKPSWFFRATSGNHQGSSTSDMVIDESDVNTPRKPSKADSTADTSAKLIKRKSFGFVPINRQNDMPFNDRREGIPPMPGSQSDLPSDLESELKDSDTAIGKSSTKKRRSSQAQTRHASYGGIGLGRASAPSSTDDLPRSRSYSRSKSRDRRGGEDVEGSRSFMGNVRRISLVGRHKRTKSGVSLSGTDESLSRPPVPPPLPQDPIDTDTEFHGIRTPSRSSNLLPPIELQPPSPPRLDKAGKSEPLPGSDSLDHMLHPSPSSPPKSPSTPSLVLKATPKTSPQSASLGRTTIAPNISVNTTVASGSVPRRNSLGDLKIPARITRAQDGLRRDLGMVREFAANVEQLKDLVTTYQALVMQVQAVIDAHIHQSSSYVASPSFFRPLSRPRSAAPNNEDSSYKNMASAFYTIKSKYKVAWECAELLIELAGGPPASSGTPPSSSTSAPAISSQRVSLDGTKNRERAITLSGEESKPPTPIPGAIPSQGPPMASTPNMAWRASTGRHDLSQRQLLLLREMLNNPDSTFVAESPHVPFDDSTMVNRDWRWGEAMNSTITLPSEESIGADVGGQGAGRTSKADKRRSRLGMSGLRDMLKMLTRSNQHRPPLPIHSTTSFSTESSDNGHAPPRYPHGKVPTYGRRRAKTSTGPDSQSSVRERDARAPSPYNVVNLSSLSVKSSPRRPSLASIFRIGNKTKSTSSNSTSMNASNEALSTEGSTGNPHTRESSSSTGDPGEEDWDRMDSPLFDLELPKMNKDVATIRGRSPYMQSSRLPSSSSSNRPQTPKRSTSGSQQSSPWPEASPVLSSGGGILNSGSSRTTRLSNVEEIVDDSGDPLSFTKSSKRSSVPSPVRTRSGRLPPSKTGSVRSMPPQPLSGAKPDVQLAMTPENIKPLFENSKEVHARLVDCINEIRGLLAES